MNITDRKFWVVRDPGPNSELSDILIETSFHDLPAYVIGTGLARFQHENHQAYDNYEEAKHDAIHRMEDGDPFARF